MPYTSVTRPDTSKTRIPRMDENENIPPDLK